jgi:membrane-associated phospholipid phosphatase
VLTYRRERLNGNDSSSAGALWSGVVAPAVPAVRLFAIVLFALLGTGNGVAWAQPPEAVRPVVLPGVAGASDVLPGVAGASHASAANDRAPRPEVSTHTGFHSLLTDLAGDFRAVPSRENLGWTLFGGGLALAVHPFDASVNQHLYGKAASRNFFLPGKTVGNGYVQVAGAIGAYAVGRLSHKPRAAHVGMDLLRAQLVAGAITYALKVTVRRERPDGSNDKSFPSGHASLTFATAIALQRHVGWEWSMPLFLVASYTAASRLHENVHYLSDVVFGATVGVIAGRTVTRHGRSAYALVPVWTPTVAGLFVQRVF